VPQSMVLTVVVSMSCDICAEIFAEAEWDRLQEVPSTVRQTGL